MAKYLRNTTDDASGSDWVDESAGGFAIKPGSPVSFTINGSAPAAGATLPAALGAPSLVLLSDVITYAATLQTRLDLQQGLIRKMLDVMTAAGLVVEA